MDKQVERSASPLFSRQWRRLGFAAAAAGLGSALAAIAAPNIGVAQKTAAPPHLNVDLGWQTYVPYVAPMLLAQKLGYFRDAGVSVSLHNGTGSAGAVQGVAAGHDDLAWVDLTTGAAAIGRGNPVIAVANVQPKGELGLTSLKSERIKSPKDILGKRIGSDPSGSDPVLLNIFLTANHLSPSQVKIEHVPGNSRIPLLLSHRIDLISGQGFHYQTLLTAQGQDSNFLLYGNYGANAIGHGFVANPSKAASEGPAIRAFLTAYEKGLQYTKDHLDQACQAFLDTKVLGFTMAMCKQEINGWLPLLSMPQIQGKAFGWNSKELWRTTVDSLNKFGGVPKKSLTDYYTNDYLPN